MIGVIQSFIFDVRYVDSVYLLVLVSSMVSGFLVTIGDGWGKIIGSERFEEDWKVALLFPIEGIIIWISIDLIQPYLYVVMDEFWTWFFCINLALTALYFVWFSNAIDHDIMEIPVIILAILATISGILAYVF